MQEVQEWAEPRAKGPGRKLTVPGKGQNTGAFKPYKPKYIHHSSGETWSGMGRKPRWIVEHLENGGDLEYFRNPAWQE